MTGRPDGDDGHDGTDRADDTTPDLHDDPAGEGDSLETTEESDGTQHRRFRIHRDLKKRLDRYLTTRLPGLSRSRLQKLINEGAVTVNSKEPKASTIIRAGDVVDVIVPPPHIKQIPAENIPLKVLYEDEHLIALNKQADLIVHPARSNLTGTMVNALAWHFREVAENGLQALSSVGVNEFRPGIVHRLDKDTTGVIVVAKTDEAHWRLGKMFERREVQKYYLAIVHGEVPPPGGVIDQPIGKHPQVAEAYAVRNDGGGRESVTLYRVREVFDGYSLVELELKSGRTHQIRVHLTWLGYPIIGDIIYGGEAMGEPQLNDPPVAAGAQPMITFARDKPTGQRIWASIDQRNDMLIRRPALHATVLSFQHPITNERVHLTAPLHDDMRYVVAALREQRRKSGPLSADGAAVDLEKVLSM